MAENVFYIALLWGYAPIIRWLWLEQTSDPRADSLRSMDRHMIATFGGVPVALVALAFLIFGGH